LSHRASGLAARLGRLARALPGLALWSTAAGCELLIDGHVASIHCLDEGASGPPACPVGAVCTDHVCVEPSGPPQQLGSRCDDDAGCAAGSFCLDPAEFTGAGRFAAGKKRCSRPCCASADCGDLTVGLVCAHPDPGGPGYCRKAVDVARAAPGTHVAGQACAVHEDCRSGLCDLAASPTTCVDSCCSDTSCFETETVCRFGVRAGAPGFWCSAQGGLSAYGASCGGDQECASGLCLDMEGAKRCSAPCCSASQCEPMGGRPVACADVSRSVFVRACATLLPFGASGEVGKACSSAGECRSGLCGPAIPGEALGRCTDTCCSDESCGAVGTFRCLPEVAGPPWPLRCEHK
jgi:hypothetical protein